MFFSVEIQSGHRTDIIFFFGRFWLLGFLLFTSFLLWIIHGSGYYTVFLSVFMFGIEPITFELYSCASFSYHFLNFGPAAHNNSMSALD